MTPTRTLLLRPKRTLRLATLCFAALLGAAAHAGGTPVQPQMELSRSRLSAGLHQIEVQLAQTPEQRSIGLMHRREMPHHEGMLFVFEQPGVQCFWMKNTLLPLTAAFVADDGRIVNLADMQPLSQASHCSEQPVRYVLEMNQGWFAKKRVVAGFRLRGPMFAPR